MSTVAQIRRTFEPSALRRGRSAVKPVWYVKLSDGLVMKFWRKKDDVRVQQADGCSIHNDDTTRGWFCECGGRVMDPNDWPSEDDGTC